MFAKLKETWNRLSTHPTGSNVIGTTIFAVGAWTFWQLVRAISAVAQSPATGQITTQVWRWLVTPVPTARIWLLASSVVTMALVSFAGWVWYRARVREVRRRLDQVLSKAHAVTTQVTQQTKALAVASLNAQERQAIEHLYGTYPAPEQLRVVARVVNASYGETEQLAERLQDLGLVKVTKSPAHNTVVVLTVQGRDLCIKSGY
jgi:DNA-binding MarR family transcriptional regulator